MKGFVLCTDFLVLDFKEKSLLILKGPHALMDVVKAFWAMDQTVCFFKRQETIFLPISLRDDFIYLTFEKGLFDKPHESVILNVIRKRINWFERFVFRDLSGEDIHQGD